MSGGLTIAVGAVVFLVITLILVGALLFAKAKLIPSGNVRMVVNGEKEYDVPIGGTVLNTLQSEGIFLSSACGGSGSCGQCAETFFLRKLVSFPVSRSRIIGDWDVRRR